MPATKPANTAEFALTPADPSHVQWPSTKEAAGYGFKDPVPREDFNGLFNRIGNWTAYLNDLVPNLTFTGAIADYDRAKIDPETEVNWGTNATFSRFTDTVSEVTLTLLHSGAGFSQLVMNRFTALEKYVVGNSSSAQISVTDYSAPAAEANQTVTVANETAVALGETRLEAGGFKPALDEPHESGTGTPYAKDEALYAGNMLRARWAGLLSYDAGPPTTLLASAVDAYNISYSGSPGGANADQWEWQLEDYTNVAANSQVVITMHDVKGLSGPYIYKPFDVAGFNNFYDSATGKIKLGLLEYEMPDPGGTTPSVTCQQLDEGSTALSDSTPQIYVTIEVYST